MKDNSSYKNQLREGKSLHKQGLFHEALEIFESLRSEYPDKAEPISCAGVSLHAMGELTRALGSFIKASELEPENAENFVNIGLCLISTNKSGMAITQFEKALKIDGNNFLALSNLGSLYIERFRYIEAVDVLTKAVKIKPSHNQNQANLGTALAVLGKYDDALKHANKAVQLNPKDAYGYFSIGHIYLLRGDMINAERYFNKTIEIDSHYGPAYYALTARKMTAEDQPLIDKMEKALNQGMPLEPRLQILYALGKAYNDLKQLDRAFTYIHKANELNNSEYDSKARSHTIRKTKKFFNNDFFKNFSFQNSTSYTPIFIVGMPRSGSTLLDQILSAHSAVYSGGESSAMYDTIAQISYDTNINKEYPASLNDFVQETADKYSNIYIQKIALGVTHATHLVDKNLFNYENLGIITMLFPKAKIIHAKRHPLDTGFSCYLTSFLGELPWTNSQTGIGKYYRDYVELMAHWHKTLPVPILDIQYEEVVEEPEKNIRRLLEFCNLEWEDQCLDFYNSKRSVNTASIWQVRQPVYKSSIQRWVPYAKHLQPLILALGDVIESDYEMIESLGLKHGPRHNNPLNKISKLFK